MLPNFLIIGAPRSGTTYLYNMLKQHPDIFMPNVRYPSDMHFFNPKTKIKVDEEPNWYKGLEWYKKQFEGWSNEKALGEKTASYLTDEDAPKLIKNTLGEKVKLIAILRNPIYRLFSNYLHFSGQIPRHVSLIEACQSEEFKRMELLESGNYAKHIKRYYQFFSKDQFLFLIYDDLYNNPLELLKKIFNFLEVDEDFIPVNYNKFYNKSTGEGQLAKLIRYVGGYIKQNTPGLYTSIEKTALGKLTFKILFKSSLGSASKKDVYSERFTMEEWAFLDKYYIEQDKALSEMLNRDLIKLWHNKQKNLEAT
jgi:hypothetical protein